MTFFPLESYEHHLTNRAVLSVDHSASTLSVMSLSATSVPGRRGKDGKKSSVAMDVSMVVMVIVMRVKKFYFSQR